MSFQLSRVLLRLWFYKSIYKTAEGLLVGDAIEHSMHDLKKLGRLELLDILVNLSKENERLQAENVRLSHLLQDRTIAIKNAGSLAEAALAVNGFFADAQAAADQYVENAQQILTSAQVEAEQIIQEARSKAQKFVQQSTYCDEVLGDNSLNAHNPEDEEDFYHE